MTEDDEDRLDLLLEREFARAPLREANPAADNVDISIPPKVLAKIEAKHGLTADDVSDIVKGQPPPVVEVCHPDDDEKRLLSDTSVRQIPVELNRFAVGLIILN